MFKHFLNIVTICTISFWAAHGAAYDPSDPRHQLVSGIKNTFAVEILERKTRLGTNYSSVAIVDFARERLESGNFTPSEPDWSLIVRYVLLGYGYKSGVIDVDALTETSRPSAAEIEIMEKGWALSSAYFYARGIDCTVDASQVYTLSASPAYIENHVQLMNQVTAAVPSDVHTAVQGVVNRVQELSKLSSFNAWFAHERFWAASGVIDPNTYAKQREMYALHTGTPVTFLDGLSRQLEQTIRALSVAGVPAADVIEDLVRQSQRILLTIAAGTPTAEGYTRLVPANIADWQTIRKALFLALSVTSNPDQADSYLSTLFDYAVFYPEKTEPDEIKSYYWKIQALAKSFSSLWTGLKAGQADAALNVGLSQVIASADPMSFMGASSLAGRTVYRGSSWETLRRSYQEVVALVQPSAVHVEIAPSLALHTRLNFVQAFQTLYPDLMAWVEYHTPSQRAQDLVGDARSRLIVPAGVKPQRMHLVYADGKWTLKAVQDGREYNLWNQGAPTTAEFVGELRDDRGVHLFSFNVNGELATIKAISSGYIINVEGNGARTVVANSAELGLIESSAYPLHGSIYTSENDASIMIKGRHINGQHGFAISHRDSVLLHAPEINFWNQQDGFETKTHAGHGYKFFVPKGHGMKAHKDVCFYGEDIHVLHTIMTAGQDVSFWYLSGTQDKYVVTSGSTIQAGGDIYINHAAWHADTGALIAGFDRDHQPPSGQVTTAQLQDYARRYTFESAQASIQYGRTLRCFTHVFFGFDEAEKKLFIEGPHAFGFFGTFYPRKKPFDLYTLPPVLPERRYDNPFGDRIRRGNNKVSSSSEWGVGARHEPVQSLGSNSSHSNTQLQSANLAFSNSGGSISIGGDLTFSSMMGSMNLGSTTMGFNYKTGDSGRSIDLYSTHVPISLADSIRIGAATGINTASITTPSLMIHMAASNAILQLTDRQGKMNMSAAIDTLRGAWAVGKPLVTRGRVVLGLAKETVDRAQEQREISSASASGSSATTGGPMGEGPEDSDEEKDLLHNDLCNQEQMSQPGKITHRGDLDSTHKDYFRDAEKFAKELGGEASDYVKKTSTARILANGETSQVHWVENLKTGQRFNFKTVMENASK